LFVEAAKAWSDDNATSMAAALAYATVFSVAPLLVIATAAAGFFFEQASARAAVLAEVSGMVGADGTKAIAAAMVSAGKHGGSTVGVVVGAVVMLVGAASVFAQLQQSLNAIWKVQAKPRRALWGFVRTRLLSFGMVIAIGFLLMVSLVLTAIIAASQTYLAGLLPGSVSIWHLANLGASLLLVAALFALIFKVLPDAKIAWQDVWVGAATTAVLFTGGKALIGLYLGRSSTASSFGAAGSLVIFLAWVYYSGLILYYGAEFTRAYAQRRRDGESLRAR